MELEPPTKKTRMLGPCVWWVRNDLRIQDNPVLRAVNGSALCDRRNFVAVFTFDRRCLDAESWGFSVTFASKEIKALHARFVRQSVLALRSELEACGSKLLVCRGQPEEILAGLPAGSEVKCQNDPFSFEDFDFLYEVEKALQGAGSKLRKDFGARGLYHPHELPFTFSDVPDWRGGLHGFCKLLGWQDISESAERDDSATPVRPTVPAPLLFAPPPPQEDLEIVGLIPDEVLADETKLLEYLGYSSEEIAEAQAEVIPQGGEPAARARLEEWMCKQNWAKASEEWSNYLIVGCISAREIFARASETPTFVEAARHLLWRDFHRVHQELEEKGPEAKSDEDLKMMKDQIKEMSRQIDTLRLCA